MVTVPASAAPLTGNLLFYNQPELLSKEMHGDLGMDVSPNRYGFAAASHVIPITVPEFGPAALSYPIIFAGEDRMPIVVLGLQEGQNLFATPEAGFELDAYVPGYVRRYPFVLATPNSNPPPTDKDQMLVGIDRGYAHLRPGGQYKLFENGEPSQYTKNCIQFCDQFEAQYRMTISFVQLLKDLDLLEDRNVTYQPQNQDGTPAGDPVVIAQFVAVSEARLNALSTEKLVDLRSNGALPQIYAHLTSMFGWERLMAKSMARQQAQAPQAANA